MDARLSAIAAATAVAGSTISHRSGLRLHGLPVVGRRPSIPDITVAPNGRGSARSAHLHRATLRPRDVVVVDAVPVTSVARTLVDVARSAPLTTAVAAIDAALNRRLVTPRELETVMIDCWNWPRIRRAHGALALCGRTRRVATESARRLVPGLATPAAGRTTGGRHRSVRAGGRPSRLLLGRVRVAGEAVGLAKYEDVDAFPAEKIRQERLEAEGLQFVRWGWADTRRPHQLRARIEAAFERGRLRDRSSCPRYWSIWRPEPGTSAENTINRHPNRAPARRT